MVMHQLMHIPAQRFFRSVAKHFARSPIDECAVSLQIDPVNALAGGFQQHLHLLRDAVSFLLRSLALGNVFR